MKKRGVNSKAQEAIEYVTIFGAVVVVIAIVVVLYAQYSGKTSDSIITENTEAAGKAIINEAKRIFYMGEGSSNTMKISIPKNVLSINKGSDNKELVFKVALSNRETEVVIPAEFKIEITSNLKNGIEVAGLKELALVSLGDTICLKTVNEELEPGKCVSKTTP